MEGKWVGVSGCGLPRPTARCPAAEGERGVARLEEVGVVWVGEKDSEKEERRGGALYKDPASRPPSPPSSSTPLSDSRTTCHTRNQTAKSQTNSSTNKSNPRPRHGTRQHARLGLPQVRSRVRRLRQVVRFLWRRKQLRPPLPPLPTLPTTCPSVHPFTKSPNRRAALSKPTSSHPPKAPLGHDPSGHATPYRAGRHFQFNSVHTLG
jgi:hypothetical protein